MPDPTADVVETARARLEEALADARPPDLNPSDTNPSRTNTTNPPPAHAASYRFALARRAYVDVADAARDGSEPAMAEIERVLKDHDALRGMALNRAELAVSVRDPERQIRAFDALEFDHDEYLEIRGFPWCVDLAARIDRRLLDIATARRDTALLTTLCASADPEVALEALKITGRALARALARAADDEVDDPLRATQHVMRHVESLRKWLTDVRQRDDEALERLATVVERRAARARERAAGAIGLVIEEEIDRLYGDPVSDVSEWARQRQHLLSAGEKWQRELAPGTVRIDGLIAAVGRELERASVNGIGWAMRSEEEVTNAIARQRRAVSLLGTGLLAAVCATPVVLMFGGLGLGASLALAGLLLGVCCILGWELHDMRHPDAWLAFYRHPPEDDPPPVPAGDPAR